MTMTFPGMCALLARAFPDPFGALDQMPAVPRQAFGRLSPATLIALAIVFAVLAIVLAWWSRRQYMALPELDDRAERPTGGHAVVIPARNEQRDIARAVSSFPDSLVCVVDDGSADRTVELAAAAGAKVVAAAPLAPSWTGKNNACWTGAQATESKWILFADARTEYNPRFLPALIEDAGAHSLQAVAVLPKPVGGTLLARLVWPCASGLYFAAVNAARVNTAQSRQSLQTDRCLLFLRSGYDFIGGHRRVSGSISVDLAFAALLQTHRMSCRTVRCESMAAVHRHASFGELWSGLLRFGCRFLDVPPGVRWRLALASLFHAAWLPVLALLLYNGHRMGAAAFYLAVALAWLPWYGPTPLVLFAPCAVYMVLACSKLGMIRHFFGLSIGWKGRRV